MASRRPRGSVTIGAVLDQLKDDFPDVSISKIRFLEAEGLVSPARTDSGYRYFTAHDVERLRFILTAQRDLFWPLKVIGEALDGMDRGLPSPLDAGGPGTPVSAPMARSAEDPDVPSPEELTAPPSLRLTRAELLSSSGADAVLLDSLISYGLVRPADDGHYDDAALSAATACAALAAYGLEARHLRPFRTAADREVGLVQYAAPVAARAGADGDPAGQVLHHALALHTALVKTALRARG